jgi:hypothetical protein
MDASTCGLVRAIRTKDDMRAVLSEYGRPEADYRVGMLVTVCDKMQEGYSYQLSEPIGLPFAPGFEPAYSPREMFLMGVFEGHYYNDGVLELPREWFRPALEAGKLSPERPEAAVNRFGVKSRLPLQAWREKGWIYGGDPRGWFQWYCRYYLGRRDTQVDEIQIGRWRGMARHAAQVRANCRPHDFGCRPRQRQTLLQWSWDAFI